MDLSALTTTDLFSLLIQIVVGTIIVAPILWIVGRALVGKDKAKFTDAIWIVVLGIVIGAIVSALIGDLGFLVSAVVMLVIWLALIKHFFDCGWIMALAIAIVAVIVAAILSVVIAAVLVFIGFVMLMLV